MEEGTTGGAAVAGAGTGPGASCAKAQGTKIELSRIIHAKHLDAGITTFSIQYSYKVQRDTASSPWAKFKAMHGIQLRNSKREE
jgi:hypothetical protein